MFLLSIDLNLDATNYFTLPLTSLYLGSTLWHSLSSAADSTDVAQSETKRFRQISAH